MDVTVLQSIPLWIHALVYGLFLFFLGTIYNKIQRGYELAKENNVMIKGLEHDHQVQAGRIVKLEERVSSIESNYSALFATLADIKREIHLIRDKVNE